VQLPPKLAVVLGMAFHELTTNAAKYGALSSDSGRVLVDWRLEGSGEGTTLNVAWCELNGPTVEAHPSLGFGSRLLRQTITQELAGQLDHRFEQEGACCKISIPIGSDESQAA
jgi:two-component sensor histidine kinase